MSAPEVAMVLAAGRGERMRPLSDVLPKPALPLPDGPVVASALLQVAALRVTRVVVNVWHLAQRMEAAARVACPEGVELTVSVEEDLLGTAGGLALARDRGFFEGDGPLLVLNGDCLMGLELGPLMEGHRARGDLVTLALLPHPEPRRWTRVVLDPAGRVTAMRAPGVPAPTEVPLLFPGVMLVAREALASLPGGVGQTPELLWQPAMAAGRLGGAVVTGRWREVGTPDAYLEAVLARLGDEPSIASSAHVATGAAVGAALLGDEAVVEAGAVVAQSVVAAGARVRRGARVIRSVLLGSVEARPGEVVVDEVRAAPAV